MDNKKQNPVAQALKLLELELKDLEEEWDRLDSMGSGVVQQQLISIQIEAAEKGVVWAKNYLDQHAREAGEIGLLESLIRLRDVAKKCCYDEKDLFELSKRLDELRTMVAEIDLVIKRNEGIERENGVVKVKGE